MENKKGQLNNLPGIMFSLIVIVSLIAALFFILGSFHNETVDLTGSNTSSSAQGLNNTLNALNIIPSILPVVVLIVMVVIILGMVFLIPGARSVGA